MRQGELGTSKQKRMKCDAQRGLAMLSTNLQLSSDGNNVPAADLHQRRQRFPAHLEHMSHSGQGVGVQGDLDRAS